MDIWVILFSLLMLSNCRVCTGLVSKSSKLQISRQIGLIGSAWTHRYSSSHGVEGATQKKTVLVPIAKGSEELETITITNTLTRAGVEVHIVSINDELEVVCSRGAVIKAPQSLAEVAKKDFDMIVCPGGMPGASNLHGSSLLCDMLRRQVKANKFVGAICAAPAAVLAPLGLLATKKATCYPAKQFVDALTASKATVSIDRVVIDGNIITSRGPGTALEFALTLSRLLCGDEVCKRVCNEMLVPELYNTVSNY